MNLQNILPLAFDDDKKKEKEEKGNLKIRVVEICSNNPVENVDIRAGRLKSKTNSSGETEIKDIAVKNYSIAAKKHSKNLDYIKFISHIHPRIVSSYKAVSENYSKAEVNNNETTEIEIQLERYRLLDKVQYKRIHINLSNDDYGHWWTEIDTNESYGWWPKYPINHTENKVDLPTPPTPPKTPPPNADYIAKIRYMADKTVYEAQYKIYELKKAACELRNTEIGQVSTGVEGELNGQHSFGGSATKDPHDGHPADETYKPVINDCRTDVDIQNQIRTFASSYTSKYGNKWSYRGDRFDNSCHTFQIRAMKDCTLDKVKKV